MPMRFGIYLPVEQWTTLKDVLEAAIEHFAEYGMRAQELDAIYLKEYIMDKYRIVEI